MTFTLDVRGDQTFVLRDGTPEALVQPDTYHPELNRWTPWRQTGNRWDSNNGWEWQANHPTREQALAACGWHEGGQR